MATLSISDGVAVIVGGLTPRFTTSLPPSSLNMRQNEGGVGAVRSPLPSMGARAVEYVPGTLV